jgi:autotransporter family porin
MADLGQRRVPKRRKFELLAASCLVPLTLGLSEPAVAQTCFPVPNGGSLGGANPTSTTCTGPFSTNINFGGVTTPPTTLQTVTLSGAQVFIPAGSGPDAVNFDNSAGGAIATLGSSAALTAVNSSILNTANPGAGSASGLRIQTNGNATITATNTPIAVIGAGNTNGIWSIVLPSSDPTTATKVVYTGPGITVAGGANSTAIQAENRGNGSASIDAAGNFTVTKPNDPNLFNFGLLAKSVGGDASVHYSSGTIDVRGALPAGIQASSRGDGSVKVITDAGTIIKLSDNAFGGEGVLLMSSGTAASGKALTADVASTIMSSGGANLADANFPTGIVAFGFRDAPITINYTGLGITTQGGNGSGIYALSAGGNITINSSGPINTTDGSNAIGILADNIFFFGASGRSNKLVTDPGTPIMGPQAAQATVTVNATDVLTMGQFGTAISATAGGNVAVNVAGSVMGGWQAGLLGVGSVSGLPAAGVILGSSSGTATLTNNGSIGALSDRAVANSPFFPSNNTSIINNGTITGFVQLVGDNNRFENNGLFNLRHFADTTGSGVRDTVRVAIADLGPGVFTNNGTLALAPLSTTPIVSPIIDSTGEYLPLGNPSNTMAFGGPLQGQLLGVTTFTNSGTIDLQSNPAVGDVLLITGGHTPGANGGGTFISGGTLRLDTVLNQGGTATQSDTLVVDGTLVGPGGPTNMAIRNAGGAGALTVGDGILVVQVLDPARSASGAFSLNGGFITAGAFDYFLFKGGATPGSQGNWYLRNELIPGTEPAPGSPPLPGLGPGGVLGGARIPLFQPGVAVMSVVPSIARSLGLLTLGTFNERQGDQLLVRGGCSQETENRLWNADKNKTRDENCFTRIGAWGRVFGQNTREHFAQGARPDFDGTFAGFQAGADLWRLESVNGHRDNIGFYVAQARASGSVHGSVDGFEGALAGHVDLDASSYGGYWTHLGPSNWYIDTVIQGTHFFGTPQSIRGVSTTVNGDAFTGSIEAGYPIHLAPWLSFEPQIQGIWQRSWLYDTLVPVSTITFDRADVFTGRAGAVLRGTFGSCACAGAMWQPYLKGNVWWGSNGFDTVYFNSFGIPTGRNGGTTLEGGGGVTGKLTRNVSVYGDASYLTSVSGESHIALKGNIGLRVTW